MAPAFVANSALGGSDSNAARLRCSSPPYLKCSSRAVQLSNRSHESSIGRGTCAKKFVGDTMCASTNRRARMSKRHEVVALLKRLEA